MKYQKPSGKPEGFFVEKLFFLFFLFYNKRKITGDD